MQQLTNALRAREDGDTDARKDCVRTIDLGDMLHFFPPQF